MSRHQHGIDCGSVSLRPSTEQANAVTHDGYLPGVILGKASDANSRDGLALAGTSPCFLNTATGTATPLPTIIEQR